jgi:alkylation response protein AidB-like acyl-CoA dehydrogenase
VNDPFNTSERRVLRALTRRFVAVRDGDHYVVNGSKTYITSGSRADFVTAAVRTVASAISGTPRSSGTTGTPGSWASAAARPKS